MESERDAVRVQYLSFSLRETEYAVGILKVKEILQCEQTTRVPATPRSVRGVINLRGQVVPVVDLAAKFGLGETEPTAAHLHPHRRGAARRRRRRWSASWPTRSRR